MNRWPYELIMIKETLHIYIKKNCFTNVFHGVLSSSAVTALSEGLLTPDPGSVFMGFFQIAV